MINERGNMITEYHNQFLQETAAHTTTSTIAPHLICSAFRQFRPGFVASHPEQKESQSGIVATTQTVTRPHS